METNKISYHNYVNSIQIYTTLSPGDNGPIQALSRCTEQFNDWRNLGEIMDLYLNTPIKTMTK